MLKNYLILFVLFMSLLVGASQSIDIEVEDSYSFNVIYWDARIPGYDYKENRDYYIYIKKENSKDFKKVYKLKKTVDIWCEDDDEENCTRYSLNGSIASTDKGVLDKVLSNLSSNTTLAASKPV